MSDNRSIARRFIQEIFNEGKIEDANRFVTPDIFYMECSRKLEDWSISKSG